MQDRSADQLRKMGIDHPLLADDDELVGVVTLLRELGVDLEAMVDTDLTLLAGPAGLRPDATIDPGDAFDWDDGTDFAREMVLAMGFRVGEDNLLLTPAEVDAVRFFYEQRNVFGDDDTLALLQVVAGSMTRIARSLITTLRMRVELPLFHETGSLLQVIEAYQQSRRDHLEPFSEAMAVLLRRHLARISGTEVLWDLDASEAATAETILVGFVDMVGFTSFTERAGQAALVDTVRTFERRVNSIVVSNGGTLVKLIGDEAMFVASSVADGLAIAAELCCLPLAEIGPSSVRVGLAWGETVAIDGDFFGTVVNLAARAVQVATPDAIYVTDELRRDAPESASFVPTGDHELRGISAPVTLWEYLPPPAPASG
ncbi:MAG: adenylate/guanylate cyclase domain-containing protein [Actinomycetota bacterium]